ncbi:MAG: hypothetical protein F6K58_19140 [Symploca sp. SIO2E9]|nr:hypothetical protein [Symploca sp. SIO2E9]
MKASEAIRRYNDGERDFRRVNLQGESFKGQNLAGADFSEADIRGTNFTNAYLIGAKFVGAKGGLQRQETIFLLLILFLLAFLAELSSVSANGLLRVQLQNSVFEQHAVLLSVLVLGLLFSFVLIWVYKGVSAGLGALISIMLVAGIVAAIGNTVVLLTDKAVVNWVSSISGALAVTVGTSGLIAGTLVLAGTVAENFTGVVIFAGALASGVAGVVIRVSSRGGIDDLLLSFSTSDWNWASIDFFWGWTFAWGVALLGGYVGWRTLAGDKNFSWLRRIAIVFAAIGGTNFYNANLTEADFTGATLKNTDLRKATLIRTRWYQAKKLDRIRPGKTYLQSPKVRQLLIEGQGQNQNFDYQSLRGVNLQGANLADASFIGADLTQANLQDADLSRATLVQTQLDKADLTGATLTGATIEDWNITSHTQLQGVRCRYVFMRLTTKDDENRRRKPDNWEEEFEDGDFADFIKPIVDTLDLYHNQAVDPRAIAISFKQLAENNPDAQLEIVAMEKRGEDKFLLRAATAPEANHSQLNAEYFQTYNEIKALAEAEVQKKLIAEKDSRIASLENMVETALRRPSFYAQTYKNQGDTMSSAPKKVSKFDLQHAQFGGGLVDADTVHAQQIGGDINNYAPEQRQNLADAAAEIQQLLQQLEQTYPHASAIEKQSALAVTLQQEIKQNPTLRARLKNALKEGGIEALKLVCAPIAIPIEMVRGWIEAEA